MLKDTLTGIALISLCILASIWLPVIGLFSYISIPMPVIFYRLKLGRKRGAFIPGAALLLTIVAAGGFSNNIFFTCELLFTGFFLGELLSADFSIEKTVLCACAASIGAAFAGIFFFSAISNASIHGLISDYVSGNIEFTLSLLNSMEMPEESRMELKNAFENLRFLLIRILPALSLISVLFVVWINIVIMRPLLKLKGIRHTNFGSLNKWKAPEFFVWIVIGCGLVMFVPGGLKSSIKILCLNCLLVFIMIYFFQGIAVISYFFEKKQFSRTFKIFVFSIIALWQMLFLVVAGIGFFDLWINFRKLETEGSTKAV